MTVEEVKEILPIIQAFVDGKIIQYIGPKGDWIDYTNPEYLSINFLSFSHNYRVKPEPKYRPFRTKEECLEEMLKHKPFGWIKYGESICNIHNIYSDSITISDYGELYSHEFNISFVNSTFVDGTPFGIKEE